MDKILITSGAGRLIHRLSHDDYRLVVVDECSSTRTKGKCYSADPILVCIPAFNEDKSIGDVIKKAAGEVLVYDDGSTDNTAEVSRAVGASVIRNSAHKGYGAAISALFEAAKKRAGVEAIVTLDADDQHVRDILNEGAIIQTFRVGENQ